MTLSDEVVFVVRWVTLVLGTVLAFVSAKRLARDWLHWSPRAKNVRITLALLLVATSIASAEQLAQDAPMGSRSFLLLFIQLWFAVGLWRTRGQPPTGLGRE